MLTVNLLRHYKTVRQRNVNTSASQQNGRKPRKIWIMLSFSFHHRNGNLNLLHQIIYNSQHWGFFFSSSALQSEPGNITGGRTLLLNFPNTSNASVAHKKKLYKACQNWANWVLSSPLFNVRHSTQLRVLSGLVETHFGEFCCCGRTGDSAAGGLTWTTWGGIPNGVQHGCPWAGWDKGPISH